jgi:hypothetical protein
MEQAVRHAPEEQAGDRPLTAGSDDNEVGAQICRRIGNRVRGAPCCGAALLVARVNAGVFEVVGLLLNLFLDFFLVDLDGVSPARPRVISLT